MPRTTKPKLPQLLERKLSKTGQTRGADDDVIYQNRVSRNNPVLIPFHQWQIDSKLRSKAHQFECGYIVLISPVDYFAKETPDEYFNQFDLTLGENALIFYETRADWERYSPENNKWTYANNRTAPLGGQYVARVPANTSTDAVRSQKVNLGYATQSPKGAGIRLYEYASKKTIKECRLQLEAIFWLCKDSVEVMTRNGMSHEDAELRMRMIFEESKNCGLLDFEKLRSKRIINEQNHTICPLCLRELSGDEFLNRLAQPEGRKVPDLTVTQVNLFHIEELKYGAFNHRQYNLGWGCHFCNVVVKDSGIYPTLDWIQNVINKNREAGYLD